MRLAAILTAIAATCAALPAQAGDVAGTVYGPLGTPVADQRVSIPALGLETVTDGEGAYSFAGIDAGEHEVAVGIGDAQQRAPVSVTETGVARRNIMLFSRNAMDRMADGIPAAETVAPSAIEDAMKLADRMLETQGEGIAWRWNDAAG